MTAQRLIAWLAARILGFERRVHALLLQQRRAPYLLLHAISCMSVTKSTIHFAKLFTYCLMAKAKQPIAATISQQQPVQYTCDAHENHPSRSHRHG